MPIEQIFFNPTTESILELITSDSAESLNALYKSYNDKILIPHLTILQEHKLIKFLYIEQQRYQRIFSVYLTELGAYYKQTHPEVVKEKERLEKERKKERLIDRIIKVFKAILSLFTAGAVLLFIL